MIVEAVADPFEPPMPPKGTLEWATKFALSLVRGSRTGGRSLSQCSRIKFVKLSEALTNSVASVCLEPLGQTPEYLDPQSQEALHEVDISGMALHFSFDQHQTKNLSEVWEGGTDSNRQVAEQRAGHDTDQACVQ